MGRFQCKCGQIVSTNSEKNVATFRRNIDQDILEKEQSIVEQYVTAIRQGTEQQWLQNYFDDADKTMDAKVVLSLIYSRTTMKCEDQFYMCHHCGRISFSVDNKIISFKPESEDWHEVFRIKRQ